MKVFVFSAHAYEIPFLEKAAEGKHELLFSDKKLSSETANLAAGCEAIALFTADDASAPVLQKLYNYGVRFVALRSAGHDHVDLGLAKKLELRVGNVPSYSPYAIAEHAVALLMALNRKIVMAQTLLRLQDFRLDALVGFDIHGKTVGIIGTGTIGMAFCKIMKGFGANIIAYDPVQNPDAVDMGVRYVSLDELFAKSDVISIHCPLNQNTRYMINATQISKMKKGVIIINTSRGAIVNTLDLVNGLENGHVGGACLDVYENERNLFFEDHRNSYVNDVLFIRLRSKRNVIITGHQAFLTVEALKGIAETTIKNLDHWEDGERAPHELFCVNQATEALQKVIK